jgi:hypothetical protein
MREPAMEQDSDLLLDLLLRLLDPTDVRPDEDDLAADDTPAAGASSAYCTFFAALLRNGDLLALVGAMQHMGNSWLEARPIVRAVRPTCAFVCGSFGLSALDMTGVVPNTQHWA